MEIDLDQERIRLDEKWYTIADLKMLIKEKIEAEELDIQKYTDALKDLKRELEAERTITIKLPANIFNKFTKKAEEVSKSIEDFLKDSLIANFEGKGAEVSKEPEPEPEPEEKEDEPEEEDIEFEIEEIDDEDEDEEEPIKEIPCPRCKSKVPIYTEDRPLDIECPNCGKKGTLKK